jgi:hypothetical protein
VNAVKSASQVYQDYVNARLNLLIPPASTAQVTLGSASTVSSIVFLGVYEAGPIDVAFLAIGLGSLSLTAQPYPITVSIASGGTQALYFSDIISFVSSEDRVLGGDVYTILLSVMGDPVAVWSLDNRDSAPGDLSLSCGSTRIPLPSLVTSGAVLNYRGESDGIYVQISNPPPCTTPSLVIYSKAILASSASPSLIVFKVL